MALENPLRRDPQDPDAAEHAYAAGMGPGPVNPMAQLIREGRYDEFNFRVEQDGPADLSFAYLRAQDLTQVNLKGANLSGAYLRGADLRGQNLSAANLAGASLAEAKVSGVLFQDNLSAQEVQMSLTQGTRMRVDLAK